MAAECDLSGILATARDVLLIMQDVGCPVPGHLDGTMYKPDEFLALECWRHPSCSGDGVCDDASHLISQKNCKACHGYANVILTTALMAQAAKDAPIKGSWNTQADSFDQSLLLQAAGDSKWFKFDDSSWNPPRGGHAHIFTPVLAYCNSASDISRQNFQRPVYKELLAKFTSDERNQHATHISLGVSNMYPRRIPEKVHEYAKDKNLYIIGAAVLDAGSAHGCHGGARDKCGEGIARMCLLELESKLVIVNPEGKDGQLRLPPADASVERYKNWPAALEQWAHNRRLATAPGVHKSVVHSISEDSLEIWQIMMNQSIYTAAMYAITFHE
jgi:hypothetical protein